MSDTVTIVGRVATDPVLNVIPGGHSVTNFRVATTHRRFDGHTKTWVDASTSFFSVSAFRQLGEHAKASLRSGDGVIVTGRLRIRTWDNNGKQGMSADIDAEAVGHDLRWGTSVYTRAHRVATNRESEAETAAKTAAERPAGDPANETGTERTASSEDWAAPGTDGWNAPASPANAFSATPF